MNKLYALFGLVVSTFLLVSFSTNPPDGKTGAPGDSFCVECHVGGTSMGGTIEVQGFPASITPNETYLLTVVNRDTIGEAIRGGFQMTILGPFNTRAGTMAMPSEDSAIAIAGGRQYFEHNPAIEYPDSNVVRWSVEWTAPEIASGSVITWYIAGNIADGNFQNTGDKIISERGHGSIVLAATEDLTHQKPTLYPNPGTDQINIILADGSLPDGIGYFYDLTGARVAQAQIHQGKVNMHGLPSGVYIVEIKDQERSHFVRWSKI